jgi:hypothetical protein
MEDELTSDARWQSQPGLDPLELGQAVVEIRRSGGDDGKRIQHFLTIQFKYPDGRGDFIELEMSKDVAPRLVAQLEARSGMTITHSGG